jgi:hypothetical protein
VLRQFDSGAFVGVIVATRSTRAYGQLWSVRYDDGDEEDLNRKQLQRALLPAAAGELPDAAGAGRSVAAGVSPTGATAALLTGGAAAADSQPSAPDQRYKGVRSSVSKAYPFERIYYAELIIDYRSQNLGSFCTAVEAARAYDDAARARGRLCVNFPRAGSGEERAVPGLRAGRHAVLSAAEVSQGHAASRQYKGVQFEASRADGQHYCVQLRIRGIYVRLVGFATVLDAVRAFDKRARSAGKLQLNFPKPGTAETQAVRGVKDWSGKTVAPGIHAAAKPRRADPFQQSNADVATPVQRFRGVFRAPFGRPSWRVQISVSGKVCHVGTFADRVAAAHAYDAAARARGILTVNFPKPGTAELQAVAGIGRAFIPAVPPPAAPGGAHARSQQRVERSTRTADGSTRRSSQLDPPPAPATGAHRPAPASRNKRTRSRDEDAAELPSVEPEPPAKVPHIVQHLHGATNATGQRFKGVQMDGLGRWQARVWRAGKHHRLGTFASAVEAAHVYDQAMRASGVLVVNFPREGTAELQAVAGVMNTVTLAAVAQQLRSGTPQPDEHAAEAAGGADAKWADAPHCSLPNESPVAYAQRQAPERHARARTSEEEAVDLPSPAIAPAAAVSPPRTAPPAVRAAHTQLHSPSSSAGAAARCSPAAAAAAAADAAVDDDMVVASPLAAPRYIVPPLAAAGPLQVGGASTPLEVPPDCPASLVGRRVLCTFPEGVLSGAVIRTRATRAYGQLWCVALEDGEEEELTWSELCAALQPSQQPAAAAPVPAAATTAPPVAAAASLQGDADAAEDPTLAHMATFLRAIRSPLSQLDAALAALPESGLSVAHLACIASSSHASPADRKMLFDELAAVLRITRAADRIGFMNAVLALAARGGASL